MVNFPIAAKVCETMSNSSLQEFNPLNDSEPNLEFDMTDQDNAKNRTYMLSSCKMPEPGNGKLK